MTECLKSPNLFSWKKAKKELKPLSITIASFLKKERKSPPANPLLPTQSSRQRILNSNGPQMKSDLLNLYYAVVTPTLNVETLIGLYFESGPGSSTLGPVESFSSDPGKVSVIIRLRFQTPALITLYVLSDVANGTRIFLLGELLKFC